MIVNLINGGDQKSSYINKTQPFRNDQKAWPLHCGSSNQAFGNRHVWIRRYFKGHFHASISQQEISSKKQTFLVVLERVLL